MSAWGEEMRVSGGRAFLYVATEQPEAVRLWRTVDLHATLPGLNPSVALPFTSVRRYGPPGALVGFISRIQ